MRKQNLATMECEDLWRLYEELATVLADKITAEKRGLEERLAKLNPIEIAREVKTGSPLPLTLADRPSRRKYPKVLPKYSNPLAPSQTWSGRGKRPKWVIAALAAGQELEELKIEHAQHHDQERSRSSRAARAV